MNEIKSIKSQLVNLQELFLSSIQPQQSHPPHAGTPNPPPPAAEPAAPSPNPPPTVPSDTNSPVTPNQPNPNGAPSPQTSTAATAPPDTLAAPPAPRLAPASDAQIKSLTLHRNKPHHFHPPKRRFLLPTPAMNAWLPGNQPTSAQLLLPPRSVKIPSLMSIKTLPPKRNQHHRKPKSPPLIEIIPDTTEPTRSKPPESAPSQTPFLRTRDHWAPHTNDLNF